MKTQIICCALAAFVHLAPGASLSWGQPAPAAGPSLALDVQTDCSRCLPGELVRVQIRARNVSPRPAALPAGADVWEGHVSVLIAFEDGPFKVYQGPGWGLRDVAGGAPIVLEPGRAYTTDATLLFNLGVRTSHLSPAYAEGIAARRLGEGYALGRPGRYRIAAVLYDEAFAGPLASSIAEVRVVEPEGADLEVWNVLRSNPGLGYLMQSGSPRGRGSLDASDALVTLAERLASDHPWSRYAEPLRRSASKARAALDDLRARGLQMR